jgi:hypothetical protein
MYSYYSKQSPNIAVMKDGVINPWKSLALSSVIKVNQRVNHKA